MRGTEVASMAADAECRSSLGSFSMVEPHWSSRSLGLLSVTCPSPRRREVAFKNFSGAEAVSQPNQQLVRVLLGKLCLNPVSSSLGQSRVASGKS